MEKSKVHPFERAGLGMAPFRFVGHFVSKYQACPGAPIQPGSSCDYCGTGIMDVFRIRSTDGKEFKVGCDCVRRTYAQFDGTIPPEFRKAIAEMERQKREVKRQAKWEKAVAQRKETLAALQAQPALFADQPHPTPSMANAGKTLRDYYLYCLEHGGQHSWGVVAYQLNKATQGS